MKDFSLKTRLYIWCTLIAGALFLGYYIYFQSLQEYWLPIIVLCVLGSFSLIFKVEGATNRTHYNITFLIYGFSIVIYGAPVAVIVIFVAHIVEWIWHKYPWYIQLFNLASYILVAVASNTIFEVINPEHLLNTWQAALSMVVLVVCFTILNHLMIGGIVWLARGENFIQSGIFGLFSLGMDLVMLSMGAGAAVIWSYNPLAIIFIILPLYLIYSTLRVPALKRQTETDQKTGVFNHHYLEKCLNEEQHRADRFEHPITIVMADLDLLRNINNTYGHLAGDEVLIGVARVLKQFSREYDIVARFGGEEFSILMPETTPEQAYPIVEKMRLAISNMQFTIPTSVTAINATMSFGIAGREPEMDGKTLINNADMALYHAKLKGRNKTFIYSKDGYNSLFLPSLDNSPAAMSKPTSSISGEEKAAVQEPPRRFKTDPSGQVDRAPIKRTAVKPVTHFKGRNWTQIYITAIALAGIALFAFSGFDTTTVDWFGLIVFTILVAATEWSAIDIYVQNTSVSVSTVPLVAGILLFGPAGVLVMGLTIAIVAFVKHHSPFSRFIFNTSNQVIAGIVCLMLIKVIGANFLSWPVLLQILVCSLTSLLIYLITSLFVAFGIHLNLKIPFRQIWSEHFSWLVLYYLGMGVIAYTLIFSYQNSGVLGTAVILVPLALLRFSQKQFIDRTKAAVQELKANNKILEDHAAEITSLNDGLLDTLAEVIDLRDPYVLGHSRQVTHYAVLIAQELGLSIEQIETIRKASLMHDVGKLGINQDLLSKPSTLTIEEYDDVKRHVTLGAALLRKSQALESLIPIVLHHHEHYDGTGYPDGLRGDEISVEARIVCLADALDAMASDRLYRKALFFDEILAEVQRCSGTHFDPMVVQAFENIIHEKGQSILINSIPNISIIAPEQIIE